jgi:hypothetical protein
MARESGLVSSGSTDQDIALLFLLRDFKSCSHRAFAALGRVILRLNRSGPARDPLSTPLSLRETQFTAGVSLKSYYYKTRLSSTEVAMEKILGKLGGTIQVLEMLYEIRTGRSGKECQDE